MAFNTHGFNVLAAGIINRLLHPWRFSVARRRVGHVKSPRSADRRSSFCGNTRVAYLISAAGWLFCFCVFGSPSLPRSHKAPIAECSNNARERTVMVRARISMGGLIGREVGIVKRSPTRQGTDQGCGRRDAVGVVSPVPLDAGQGISLPLVN